MIANATGNSMEFSIQQIYMHISIYMCSVVCTSVRPLPLKMTFILTHLLFRFMAANKFSYVKYFILHICEGCCVLYKHDIYYILYTIK